jgi:TonB family protein
MKPCYYTSVLFHGALLFLLFSWGIPLADKFSPRNVIEVSLIVGETEKAKENLMPPRREKRGIKKSEPKEKPAPLTKTEEAKKEDLPKNMEKKEETPEIRPKEEKVLPQRAEPDEGPGKTAGREEPPLSFSPQRKEEAVSSTGGAGKPGASLVAALNSGIGAGGIPIGIPAQEKEPGQGRGTGNPQTARVHGNSQQGDETLGRILRKIEAAKKYPRKARKMGIEGKALVRFKMRPDGCIETVELVESSGSEILDQASLETVRNAAPLPYKEGWLKVGIVFKIL